MSWVAVSATVMNEWQSLRKACLKEWKPRNLRTLALAVHFPVLVPLEPDTKTSTGISNDAPTQTAKHSGIDFALQVRLSALRKCQLTVETFH